MIQGILITVDGSHAFSFIVQGLTS